MTIEAVRETLWRIADRALRGLVPRPYVSIEVGEDEVDGERFLWWELEFSQARPILGDRVSPVEVAFSRSDTLLSTSPVLECTGEEHGDCAMALTGGVKGDE